MRIVRRQRLFVVSYFCYVRVKLAQPCYIFCSFMAVPKRQRNNIFVKLKQFRYPHSTISVLKQSYNNRQVCGTLSGHTRFYLFADFYKMTPRNLRLNASRTNTAVPSIFHGSAAGMPTSRATVSAVFLGNCSSVNSVTHVWFYLNFFLIKAAVDTNQLRLSALWSTFCISAVVEQALPLKTGATT